MSWLHLKHSTVYDYAEPVLLGSHRLVLRPREGHDLRVDDFVLKIEPATTVHWHRDIFGNSIAVLSSFEEPTAKLSIVAESMLWRSLADPSPPASMVQNSPVVYDPLEAGVADAYRASIYPQDRDAVLAWLGAAPAANSLSAYQILEKLSARIQREIVYMRREEKGVYSPAQTLLLRTGSCRDMATLFLEAGRALGFAMRFASGYLECAASRAGVASSHAWVEAYLPELGWRGFDSTSGGSTTAEHIVCGVSNHPRGVMPVSGYYAGERTSLVAMKVHVTTERVVRREQVAVL